MFLILSRTVSPAAPKLHSLRNQTWVAMKFSSAISPRSKAKSFTVAYLVDSCGFSPEQADSVSKRLSFAKREKPNLVIEFFKRHGFSQSQVLSIIRRFPRVLLNHEKSLKPKIEFFKSVGFSDSDTRDLILGRPSILGRSLQNEIIPGFDFFNAFMCKRKLMKAVIRHPEILCDHVRISALNIKLMREEGIPESNIVRFVEYYPRTLKQNPKLFAEKVQEVKELGFDSLRMSFAVAVHVKICIGRPVWTRKEAIFRKWGWSNDDMWVAFRGKPFYMATSEKKIEAVMNFLVNKLGYDSSAIVKYSVVFTMSLEKRIIPRGSVILVLMSRGLVNRMGLSIIYNCNEISFLERFVHHPEKEAEELLKLYQAKKALAKR